VSGLLVTGASGYLGGWVLHLAATSDPARWRTLAGTWHTHPYLPLPGVQALQVDWADGAAARACLQTLQPEVVIHAAASNRDPGNLASIVPAARHLAEGALRQGFRLVHVSTDMVFDGEHAPYADDSPPAPITPYGRAKAEAEAIVAAVPGAAWVRPSLIWSLKPVDRQTQWLLDGVRLGQPVTLFTDEYRCPVHVDDLAAALLELAARPELAGPFNLGGAQALNRWDFGQRILRALDLGVPPTVLPGTVAASGLARPRDLTLSAHRAMALLNTRLRGVSEILPYGKSHPEQG
jgi:dTDP-4-dehydrorhamnose reductase